MVGRYENQDENGRWYTPCTIGVVKTLNFIIGFVACTCWQQQTKQQPTNVHPGRQPVLTSLNLRFRQNKQFKQPTKQIL